MTRITFLAFVGTVAVLSARPIAGGEREAAIQPMT